MTQCERCAQLLVCPSHGKAITAKEPVTLCREDAAIWVRVLSRKRGVDDFAPIPGVGGVVVKIGKHEAETDRVGFAGFDPLPPDTHTAEITLGDVGECYRDPDPSRLSETVAADQIKTITFELVPRAVLTVHVVERDKREHGFDGATVRITGGPKPLSERTVNGIAKFGPMKDREYTVEVTLDAKGFVSPKATKKVELGTNDRDFDFEIEPVNVVTPKTVPTKTVSCARGGPGTTAPPTKIELLLEQSNRAAHPFATGGTLVADPKGVLEIFTDQACDTPFGDAALAEHDWASPLPLFLRGKAGTEPTKVRLTFAPADPKDAALLVAEPTVVLDVALVEVRVPTAVAAVLPPTGKGKGFADILAVGAPGPGSYLWKELAGATNDAAIEEGAAAETLRIGATTPGTVVAQVEYATNAAPTVKASAKSTAIFFRIEPTIAVVAVDAKDGSTLEPEVKGLPDTGKKAWKLGVNDLEAAVEGGLELMKLAVKAKKAGLVPVELAYTPEGAGDAVVAKGAVAFVGASITKITSGTTAVANVPAVDRKEYEVLVDLAEDGTTADPVAWKTGRVVLESAGKPAELDGYGITKVLGSYEWTKPADGALVKIAATQPDTDHAKAKAKVLLRAIPKAGPVGPLADPGYEDEKIEVTFDLQGQKAKDEITLRVHRHGCSRVKWTRSGGGVDANDRLEVCTHGATPQWTGKPTWTEPPGGGAIARLKSRGHQHGGWCYACSGLGAEGTGSTPRDVWHWVPVADPVLANARTLANAIVDFVKALGTVPGTFQATHAADLHGATLFTPELWAIFRKKKASKAGTANAHYNKGSKMFGVLRGWNDRDEEKWLYSLSGGAAAAGTWCPPLDLGLTPDTQRDIPSYHGAAVTYVKATPPFGALGAGWKNFGNCAAPKLLAEAMRTGLRRIELTEIWIDLAKKRAYTDRNEIGSCAQCRRYLGRLLCEKGTR